MKPHLYHDLVLLYFSRLSVPQFHLVSLFEQFFPPQGLCTSCGLTGNALFPGIPMSGRFLSFRFRLKSHFVLYSVLYLAPPDVFLFMYLFVYDLSLLEVSSVSTLHLSVSLGNTRTVPGSPYTLNKSLLNERM